MKILLFIIKRLTALGVIVFVLSLNLTLYKASSYVKAAVNYDNNSPMIFELTGGYVEYGQAARVYLKIYGFDSLVSPDKTFKGKVNIRYNEHVLSIDTTSVQNIKAPLHESKVWAESNSPGTIEVNWEAKINDSQRVLVFELKFRPITLGDSMIEAYDASIGGFGTLDPNKVYYLNNNVQSHSDSMGRPSSNLDAEKVTLIEKTMMLEKGDYRGLAIISEPADIGSGYFIWMTDNPAVATVNQWGMVYGVSPGRAVITVRDMAGKTVDYCSITIVESKFSFENNQRFLHEDVRKGAKINLRQRLRMKGTTYEQAQIEWKSENERVAVVDQNGMVTAVGYGMAQISAVSKSGQGFVTCIVTVRPMTPELRFVKDSIEIEAGQQYRLELEAVKGDWKLDEGEVDWVSSNERIITVDQMGLVTGISQGKASIRALNKNLGVEYVAFVNVGPKVPDVRSISFEIRNTENFTDIPLNLLKDTDLLFIRHRGVIIGLRSEDILAMTSKDGTDKEGSLKVMIRVLESGNKRNGIIYDINLFSKEEVVKSYEGGVEIFIQSSSGNFGNVSNFVIEQLESSRASWKSIDSRYDKGSGEVKGKAYGLGKFTLKYSPSPFSRGLSYILIIGAFGLGIASRQFLGSN